MQDGRTIHKYTLHTDGGAQILYMPLGAVVKKVAMQRDRVCIWAIVNTAQETKVRHVYETFGTGDLIPKGCTYIDTVFDGSFVWHLFEWED